TGCERRFQLIGELESGAVLYDDYAHHPTEIAATLNTVKRLAYSRAVVIHQPHTYSRLQGLYDDYAELFRAGKVLSGSDVVIFADIYAARENAEDFSVSSEKLAKDTGRLYLGGFDKIARWIDDNTREGDIVLTVGAGDIVKITGMVRMKGK
ncbi:MAG: UDP-N-acetylmuramate--L-alanine ligase, partial [Clostridiales bacterium]|nr:UDP-N-acetylmuramate--L-alanine ligase [Clostridiales bacterium]